MVTAVGAGGVGEQILKALALANAVTSAYRLIGADMGASHKRGDGWEPISLPPAGDERYLSEIMAACKMYDVKVLFPGSEQELVVLAKNASLFANAGLLVPINSWRLIQLCMDKFALGAKLEQLGFTVPKSVEITAITDLDSVSFFPVVVKPNSGGRGSADVFIAQDIRELKALASFLHLEDLEQSFIVQEYVGSRDSEFSVSVLHDLDGVRIDSIAVKRDLRRSLSIRTVVHNRTRQSRLGSELVVSSGVSQGVVGKFAEVTRQAEAIADALGSEGPMNLQGRFVDGVFYVFEINPRYSGTTSLRSMCGFNEPELMIRHHHFGEAISRDNDWPEKLVVRSLLETVVEGPEYS